MLWLFSKHKMRSYKKYFLYLFFVISMVIIFFFSVYSFVIFKPNKTLKFIDKFLIYEYSLNTNSVLSNNSFFQPNFEIEELQIFNQDNKEALNIFKLNIGFDIFKTLTSRSLYLTNLEIRSITIAESSREGLSSSFSINGKNLKIFNNEFNLSSEEFNILAGLSSIKILLKNGNLNSYPYKNIKSLIDINNKKVFYTSSHEIDNKVIAKIDRINLSSLKDYSIKLDFDTKGFFEFKTNKSRRLDRLKFYDTNITTETGFEIKNIQTTLYSSFNNSLYGLFQSDLPDQKILGSLSYANDKASIRTEIAIIMDKIIDKNPYFRMSGSEIFLSTINYSDNKFSAELYSDLTNTQIYSSIDEIKKTLNKKLGTSIYIEDISNPTYKIKNNLMYASINTSGNGFFSYGGSFKDKLDNNEHNDGLYIYLNLNSFDFSNISIDSTNNDNNNLKSIKIKSKRFSIFENQFTNVYFDTNFKNQIKIIASGDNLNGEINIDDTNFIKVDLKDSQFNFNNLKSIEFGSTKNVENINLRFIGKRIQAGNNLINNIDFYLLKNKNILTLDNIKVDSEKLVIGSGKDNEKAYISYNNKLDLYKIKGKYRLDNSSKYFDGLTKYNFEFLRSDLNIQWNSLETLTNLEGKLDFLIKDLNLDREIPESTFLRALRILNLNGIVDGLDDASDGLLNINRASGEMIIGKNRALITKPVMLETDEASMKWSGEILKDQGGELNELNLDLSMRLKISENMPWYAAIFGGIPAIAGTVVLEKLFEDSIENATTINFDVNGSIDEPKIKRLN